MHHYESELCQKQMVRLQALMGVIVLQLMREAEEHLGQLTSMLRSPRVAALPGTVAIVAVKAAHAIALHRPFFISKILPVLLGLASPQACFTHTYNCDSKLLLYMYTALIMLRCLLRLLIILPSAFAAPMTGKLCFAWGAVHVAVTWIPWLNQALHRYGCQDASVFSHV